MEKSHRRAPAHRWRPSTFKALMQHRIRGYLKVLGRRIHGYSIESRFQSNIQGEFGGLMETMSGQYANWSWIGKDMSCNDEL